MEFIQLYKLVFFAMMFVGFVLIVVKTKKYRYLFDYFEHKFGDLF